jgi:hypothetical protein
MSELSVGSLKGLAANAFKIEVASGSQLVQPGSILQVVSTTKTDTFSTTSTSFTDITGLSVSITPSSTSSKIMVFGSVNVGSAAGQVGAFINLIRESTNIYVGDTAGSRISASGYSIATSNQTTEHMGVTFLDSPATTSSVTYKLALKASVGSLIGVNRTVADVNDVNNPRTPSTITVMEVAG